MTGSSPDPVATLSENGITAVFDHCAVAAPRLRDLLPLYRDVLGGVFANGGDNQRIGYRAMQLAFGNGSRIELMEPLAGSTFFDSFFRRGGGLHHVTFKVNDLRAAIALLEDRSVPLTGLYLGDPNWLEVFIHPRDAQGVLVQLAQAPPGFPAPPGDLTIEDILAGKGSPTGEGNGIPSP
ncbi:MAG: VOC family protein [Acidimicrobiia bacterium]